MQIKTERELSVIQPGATLYYVAKRGEKRVVIELKYSHVELSSEGEHFSLHRLYRPSSKVFVEALGGEAVFKGFYFLNTLAHFGLYTDASEANSAAFVANRPHFRLLSGPADSEVGVFPDSFDPLPQW